MHSGTLMRMVVFWFS